MPILQVLQLGTVDYGTALKLQETLVELRKQGRIADTLLLLEHSPVITLGRNAKMQNIVASPEFLAERGIEVFEINRGGDVTFHGLGQLVGYPIVDLRGYSPRLGAVEFVRKLEEALIRTCGEYHVVAERVPGMTGVWTEGHAQENDQRKIAAIGIHISRGVTYHGFALNVTIDLDYFKLIVPCGISDKPVTSMAQELGSVTTSGGKRLEMQSLSQTFTRQFGNVFGTQILWLESLESLLSSGPANQDVPLREPDDLKKLHDEIAGHDDITFSA
jgi:lipoyl(octanoyl) transferase